MVEIFTKAIRAHDDGIQRQLITLRRDCLHAVPPFPRPGVVEERPAVEEKSDALETPKIVEEPKAAEKPEKQPKVEKTRGEVKPEMQPKVEIPRSAPVAISKYGWSDGKKAVSIYIELDGLDDVADDGLAVESKEREVSMTIASLSGKTRRFALASLAEDIGGVNVVRKKGKNTVVLKLQKKKEKRWFRLIEPGGSDGTFDGDVGDFDGMSLSSMIGDGDVACDEPSDELIRRAVEAEYDLGAGGDDDEDCAFLDDFDFGSLFAEGESEVEERAGKRPEVHGKRVVEEMPNIVASSTSSWSSAELAAWAADGWRP